ncbi:MAG: hypothetical protein ACP5G2_01405 [Candidatus Bipolaricaulaceae bacterium]
MTRLVAALLVTLAGWGWGHGGTLTVGPDREVYDFVDLRAAVAAARQGDEVVIAPGRYVLAGTVSFGTSLTLRGAGEVVLEGAGLGSAGLLRVGGGTVRFIGLTFQVGVGICAGCHVEVCRCTFRGCKTAVAAASAARVTLHGCQFAANGVAVAGDHPCQVTGTGNRFVGNGIDLAGDVYPNLRSHLREAAQVTVTYPGGGYESLQEAVDALVPGGRLLLAAPVAE